MRETPPDARIAEGREIQVTKRVQVPCLTCGILVLEAEQVTLQEMGEATTYRFECPSCGVVEERAIIVPGLVDALLEAGVHYVGGRPEWEPIKWDDLIDFHFELEELGGMEDRHEAQRVVAKELGVTFPMYTCPPGYLWKQSPAPRVRLLGGNDAYDVCVVLYAGAESMDGKLYGVENLVAEELVPEAVDRDECRARASDYVVQLMRS